MEEWLWLNESIWFFVVFYFGLFQTHFSNLFRKSNILFFQFFSLNEERQQPRWLTRAAPDKVPQINLPISQPYITATIYVCDFPCPASTIFLSDGKSFTERSTLAVVLTFSAALVLDGAACLESLSKWNFFPSFVSRVCVWECETQIPSFKQESRDFPLLPRFVFLFDFAFFCVFFLWHSHSLCNEYFIAVFHRPSPRLLEEGVENSQMKIAFWNAFVGVVANQPAIAGRKMDGVW